MEKETALAVSVIAETLRNIGETLLQAYRYLDAVPLPETPCPRPGAADPQPDDAADTKTAETPAPVSFEEVRHIMTEKAGQGCRAEIRAILARHGLHCLSDAKDKGFALLQQLKAEAEAVQHG